MTEPALLELTNVTVARGDRDVLRSFSLTLSGDENVAILGPNGCGKSTLVKLISREIYPRAGGVCRVLGRERWNVWDLRSQLGIITNDLQAEIDPELVATDVVLSGFSGHTGLAWRDEINCDQKKKAKDALKRIQAEHLADRTLTQMSSGESRRVMIARALAHQPKALLFDEPTTSLDIVAAHDLLLTIRELCVQGVKLVLVTHHFEEIVPEIQRVVLLRRGEVVANGLREDVMTSDIVSQAYERELIVEGNGPYTVTFPGGSK